MPAAITTADATLSSNIAKGQSAVEGLQEGGQGVLSASVCSILFSLSFFAYTRIFRVFHLLIWDFPMTLLIDKPWTRFIYIGLVYIMQCYCQYNGYHYGLSSRLNDLSLAGTKKDVYLGDLIPAPNGQQIHEYSEETSHRKELHLLWRRKMRVVHQHETNQLNVFKVPIQIRAANTC